MNNGSEGWKMQVRGKSITTHIWLWAQLLENIFDYWEYVVLILEAVINLAHQKPKKSEGRIYRNLEYDTDIANWNCNSGHLHSTAGCNTFCKWLLSELLVLICEISGLDSRFLAPVGMCMSLYHPSCFPLLFLRTLYQPSLILWIVHSSHVISSAFP